jgi:uncharacterized repeat protein (TIGR02543 family)
MKKLKYLSTLLLSIIFLSACNVSPTTSNNVTTSSSTSSASSSSMSSSVSSVNQLTSIDITTTSSILQVLGSTTRVEVSAKFNAGELSVDSVEWYLNGVRSITQSGAIFDFTPNESRTYTIQARKGSVSSNTIQVSVDKPSINLNSVNVVNTTQIRVVADPGMSFSLSGINISTTSTYSLSNRTYTLNLNSPLTQGTRYSLNVTRDNFKDFVYSFNYDTRSLEVGYIVYRTERIPLASDGTYRIARPITGSFNYTISLQHKDLNGASVPTTVITSVPTGATPVPISQVNLNVQRDININFQYPVTFETGLGLYTHSINVNGVALTVNVQVIDPTPSLELDTKVVFDDFDKDSMSTPFGLDADGDYLNDFVTVNTNGEYVINRPFKGSKKTLTFRMKADNFRVPFGLSGNQFFIRFALIGPAGPLMYYERTISSATANSLPLELGFSTSRTSELVHYVDSTTDLGLYQFTVTVYGATAPISRTVKVLVTANQPSIVPYLEYNGDEVKANSDGSFSLSKPIGSNQIDAMIGLKVKYYESPGSPNPQSVQSTGIDTRYTASPSQDRWLLNYFVSYSGGLNRVSTTTKVAIELGQSVEEEDTTEVDVVESIANDDKEYNRFTSDGDELIIDLSQIPDLVNYTEATSIFSPFETLTSATFPGTHIFSIQLGALSTTLVIRIVESSPNIILKEDSIRFGFSEETVSEDNVTYNQALNKYYVNGVNGLLELDVYPFGMQTGSYIYSYSVTKPNGVLNSTTNSVNLTLRTDVSGPDKYDGTLKFPTEVGQPGREMIVRDTLDQEGEYVYSFRVNNRTLVLSIVVLSSPQLRVFNLSYNGASLPRSGDNFYTVRSETTRFFELVLEPVNIDPLYEYVLLEGSTIPTGEALTLAKRAIPIENGYVNTGFEIDSSSGAAVDEVVDSFFVLLYKENNIVGVISKINIVSSPLNFSTLFFNTNGGTAVSPITNPVGTSGVALASLSTKSGFDLVGWYTDPTFAAAAVSNSFTHAATDTILYASWTERFSINYTLNGGTNNVANPSSFNILTPTITLAQPTRVGYVFGGWFGTEALSGSAITTIPLGSDENVALFAKWDPEEEEE